MILLSPFKAMQDENEVLSFFFVFAKPGTIASIATEQPLFVCLLQYCLPSLVLENVPPNYEKSENCSWVHKDKIANFETSFLIIFLIAFVT